MGLKARAKATDDVSIGGRIEYELISNSSAAVNQLEPDTGAELKLRWADVDFKSKKFGTLRLGHGATFSDGTAEMDLSGTKKNFKEGVNYLRAQRVDVQNASQEVNRNEQICTHCGACTAVCPTSALSVKRPDMSVSFEQQKCSVCELCVPACPTRAMKVKPTNQAFF